MDRNYKDTTRLRSERLLHLNNLMKVGGSHLLIPDGPSGNIGAGSNGANDIRLITNTSDTKNSSSSSSTNNTNNTTNTNNASNSSNSSKSNNSNEITTKSSTPNEKVNIPELHRPRSCYTCKTRFFTLHHFYDQLCPECAELNYTRRMLTCDMTDRIVLVTGGRVKIGYQTVLKLLRSNATVIVTTRFPKDAAARYGKELDHSMFKSRLHIFGLDFRYIPGVETFCKYLKYKFNRLDGIINNATQTVRRPPAYYSHLLTRERTEMKLIPSEEALTLENSIDLFQWSQQQQKDVLGNGSRQNESSSTSEDGKNKLKNQLLQADGKRKVMTKTTEEIDMEIEIEDMSSSSFNTTANNNDNNNDNTNNNNDNTTTTTTASSSSTSSTSSSSSTFGKLTSSEMSQVNLQKGDTNLEANQYLPTNMFNASGQQIDLRENNSWKLKLEDVQTPELLEVFTINTMAPFILNGHLKPLMCSEVCKNVDKYIINVSAMEGKFYRYKTPNHPHTNMAKAAINMMTRTSSSDYAKSNIYMNAVDTGWINDENPLKTAQKIFVDHHFQTPIDEVDAAARIVDPIFQGVLYGKREFGKFYKDYKETEW